VLAVSLAYSLGKYTAKIAAVSASLSGPKIDRKSAIDADGRCTALKNLAIGLNSLSVIGGELAAMTQ
jgi:hypothetical protein